MGEAKNKVPPNTWSVTRPGIIIIANLLPSTLGAGVDGNVEDAGRCCQVGRSPQICTVSYSVTSKNVLLIP